MEFEGLIAYDACVQPFFKEFDMKFRTAVAVCALSALPLVSYAQDAKIMPVPPIPAPASSEPRLISVSGECVRQVTPDRGLITATANYQHPTSVKDASAYVMKQYEQFRAAVDKMGLKDLNIQTADYNVTPIYQWVQPDNTKPGKQVLQGYQARLGLSVKTSSIDKLGEVIATAGEIGIAEVGGFQLMLSNAAERQVREECLSEAVKNATSKAQKMVTAAGARLGAIVTLNEGYQGPVFPMYANQGRMAKMEMAASDGAAAPSIQAGSTTIQVNVQAAFAIE
jgi:uncharacterized protein